MVVGIVIIAVVALIIFDFFRQEYKSQGKPSTIPPYGCPHHCGMEACLDNGCVLVRGDEGVNPACGCSGPCGNPECDDRGPIVVPEPGPGTQMPYSEYIANHKGKPFKFVKISEDCAFYEDREQIVGFPANVKRHHPGNHIDNYCIHFDNGNFDNGIFIHPTRTINIIELI